MELHNCEWCIQIVFESAKDGLWERAGVACAARQRQRALPAVEGGAGLRQLLRRPVERVAVMRHQEGEADCFARRGCEDVAYARDVAERLRHLDAVDGQHLVVHPDPREGMARMRALALRNLVLVVRENEVEPAAMDVEGLAELGLAHRRAFDMPARPAAAPRAVPTGLVGGAGLP